MKIILNLIIVTFFTSLGFGQRVSTKSAQIHIDANAKSAESIILPEINWIQPVLEYTNSSENNITFKAQIFSESGFKEVEMLVVKKESDQVLSKKSFPVADDEKELKIDQDFFMPDGDILFKIRAVSAEGGTVSSSRSVLVGMEAVKNAVAIDRKDYALVFATDKYDNWGDLVNPIYDGNTIAEELRETYGFEVEVVENATKDQVFEKILEYNRKQYKPQDQLMIFFAGHGQFDEGFGEGYVVAKNSLAVDEGKTSYISHSRLKTVINNIDCKHILLTMDVCFGGTLDPKVAAGRGQNLSDPDQEFLAKKLSHTTRRYLTSGGKEYVSDGIPGEHSPFAKKLLEALRTYGSDRILTLAEIKVELQKLDPTPRQGEFGKNEALSDFVFVAQEF